MVEGTEKGRISGEPCGDRWVWVWSVRGTGGGGARITPGGGGGANGGRSGGDTGLVEVSRARGTADGGGVWLGRSDAQERPLSQTGRDSGPLVVDWPQRILGYLIIPRTTPPAVASAAPRRPPCSPGYPQSRAGPSPAPPSAPLLPAPPQRMPAAPSSSPLVPTAPV